jgi:hypothetical protein
LDIPRPEVEVKEPQQPFSPANPAEAAMEDSDMPPPPQIVPPRPRTRAKDPWDLSPFPDDYQDPRLTDDLFSARPESNRFTNGISSMLQRGRDESDPSRLLLRRGDLDLEGGNNASRFGALDGLDQANRRDGDLLGRNNANNKDDSFLFKIFNRDPAAPDQFNAWGYKPFGSESRSLTGEIESAQGNNKLGSPMDAWHSEALSPGNVSYDIQDNRRIEDKTEVAPGYGRAWEPPPPSHPVAAKSYSNPDHIDPSHVVAPNRPINLQRPKLPGDPNPF